MGGNSGTYLVPANVPISCSWQCHRDRPNGGSPEPGTDYATAYGVDIAMAEAGTVSVIDTSPGGGEGRRLSIDLDDGRRVSYIHLSQIMARVGQRVSRGQRGLALSGASGNGSDWYYGPHVHVSLWQRPGMAYRDTIDFERYVGNPPAPKPPPDNEDEDEDMAKNSAVFYTRSRDNQTVFLAFNATSGWWMEWLSSKSVIPDGNNAIAATLGTGSFARVGEPWANAVKSALDSRVGPERMEVVLSLDKDGAA